MNKYSFVKFFKENGVIANKLAYCENNCEFKFYFNVDGEYFSLSDGEKFAGNGEIKPIFESVSDNNKIYKFNAINSRFLYGNFAEITNKYLLQNMLNLNKNVYGMKEPKYYDFYKLMKIENKINSIKNLETTF